MGRDALMCSCGRQKVEAGNDLCATCRHEYEFEQYRREEERRVQQAEDEREWRSQVGRLYR